MRAQPYKIELLKSGLMALCGLLLALQPWVGLLRGVGWVLLLAGGILFLALLLKVSAAKRVLREPLASFACGAVVCRRGVLFEGQLYNFSTFGTDVTGLDLLEDRLVFAFSFVAKGKTRGRDVLAIPFEPEELEKARAEGVAVERGEYKPGLQSVAAPIFSGRGECSYAIGIVDVMRAGQWPDYDRLAQAAKQAAAAVSRELGWTE